MRASTLPNLKAVRSMSALRRLARGRGDQHNSVAELRPDGVRRLPTRRAPGTPLAQRPVWSASPMTCTRPPTASTASQGRPGGLDRRAGVGDWHAAVDLRPGARRSDLMPRRDERAEQRDSLGLHDQLPGLSRRLVGQNRTILAELDARHSSRLLPAAPVTGQVGLGVGHDQRASRSNSRSARSRRPSSTAMIQTAWPWIL